jgi:pilus assembly protein Flp/PilA
VPLRRHLNFLPPGNSYYPSDLSVLFSFHRLRFRAKRPDGPISRAAFDAFLYEALTNSDAICGMPLTPITGGSMFRKKRPAVYSDESGATAIEYALIAALVSIAFIIALLATGSSIDDMLGHVANVLADAANQVGSD